MSQFKPRKRCIPLAAIASLILVLTTATSAWAYRMIEQLEDAHELRLIDVNLPGGATGLVRFLACDGCAMVSLRVTHRTTYYCDDTQMSLADFLQVTETIRLTADGTYLTGVSVFFDVASQRVNRLKLFRY